MINNRQQQAGRRRGRGGGNNNGGPRQGNPGRPDNGNRIDSRARGNASQLHEKYKNMASDAQRQGDRVNTEYYLQFADHYFRVLSEQRGRFEEQPPRRQRDDFDFDGDGDFGSAEFGDEGERATEGGEQQGQRFDRDDRPRGDDRGRDNSVRDDRQADGRQQRDDRPRSDGRDDRPRTDGRDDRPRNDNRDDRPRGEYRDDRPRGENRDGVRRDGNGDVRPRGEWQERPRRERPPEQPRPEQPRVEQAAFSPGQPVVPIVEVAGQRRADPMIAGESLEARAEEVLEADRPLDAPPPRRRGRPRRDAETVAVPIDGEANGFEADRLPPALTTAANDEAPTDPKPRRRRARPAEAAE